MYIYIKGKLNLISLNFRVREALAKQEFETGVDKG